MNILITGIFGFLGSNLAKKLSEKHSLTGLYNTKKNVVFDKSIVCHNNLESIDTIPDLIIMCHAAVSSGSTTIDKTKLFETNVDFTKQIVEKFPEVKIIYISSVSVFDTKEEIIFENAATNPKSDYAISKLSGEKEVNRNSDSIIIRFSSLYGNGMKENTLIPNYCNQAMNLKSVEVWGDGSRLQNYIHIDDAVKLIEKTIDYNAKIDFPILGVSSKEFSNLEVAKIISELTSSEIKFINEDNSPSFRYNNNMTQKILNWHPETELKTDLKNYLEWKRK